MTERRAWPRSPSARLDPTQTACVRPGRDVRVLDLSQGGVLIEGRARFVPNSIIDLRLVGRGRAVDLRGRVVRCYVSGLAGGMVWYRAGVAFDGSLDLSEFVSGGAPNVGRR